MSILNNLLTSKISDLHSLLLSGKITPTLLFELCYQRLEKTKELNSLITPTIDLARDQAQKSSHRFASGQHLGVLDGIPIAVKDNFVTAGIRTTCASKMLQNFVPSYSATVVENLVEKNGGVLMGKTNLDEFAMGCGGVDSIYGPCVNPWNSPLPFEAVDRSDSNTIVHSNEKDHTPGEWYISGGSSGGSAVAVASGAVYAALASDTGGSTRNPAAHCGIVGFKPSYGTCSRYGLVPLNHSMDTPSIMARTVGDVEHVFQAIQGWDVRDSTSSRNHCYSPLGDDFPVTKLTVGLPDEYLPHFLSPEIRSLIDSVINLLKSRGINVVPVSLPHTPYSLVCYSVINSCEVASNFACYDGIQYGHRSDKVISRDLTTTNSNNSSNSKPGKPTTSETRKIPATSPSLSSISEGPLTSSGASSFRPKTFEELITASRDEAFGDNVKGRILAGNYFLLKENYEKFFLRALKVRRLIVSDFDKVFYQQKEGGGRQSTMEGEKSTKVDLLLAPVTLTSAYRFSEWTSRDATDKSSGEDYCTQPVNMAGLPALSLPCSLSPKTNLPLGLQIIAPRYHDNVVLAFAKYLESLVSFPQLVFRD